jgi:hypothetical protein
MHAGEECRQIIREDNGRHRIQKWKPYIWEWQLSITCWYTVEADVGFINEGRLPFPEANHDDVETDQEGDRYGPNDHHSYELFGKDSHSESVWEDSMLHSKDNESDVHWQGDYSGTAR